jgi:hypothetical protein
MSTPGPTEDEWHRPLPPPKVAPKALAAHRRRLATGSKMSSCGDVAKDLAERWRHDPKVLEREMAGGAHEPA